MSTKPDPVDIHVGKRIRARRHAMGLTQAQLGDTAGVKFQQIQKYEIGANRVSASRLVGIAKAPKTDPAWFFVDLGEHPKDSLSAANAHEASLLLNFRKMTADRQLRAAAMVADLATLPSSRLQQAS